MAVPADADTVLKAVRLGWSMSEVRGRSRPGWIEGRVSADRLVAAVPAPPDPAKDNPGWDLSPLPLETELTPEQLCQEVQAVLGELATDLGVNDDKNPKGTYSSRLSAQAAALVQAQEGNDSNAVETQWQDLAKLIQDFDWYVQDTLVKGSETVNCGYQLGRALADSYWALNPSQTDSQNPTSWQFLFSSRRCTETERLLGRLSAYFHPYTSAAIAGSLQVWKTIAAEPAWAASVKDDKNWPDRAAVGLYAQIRRWYELILLKQDPTTLIQPYQLIKNWRMVWRAVRMFWFQLLLALLAAGALAGFAYLLATPPVSSWGATVLGALGITGVTVAGLAAKLKNDAQAMLTRIKEDAYTDLIAVAITTAPPPPTPGQPLPASVPSPHATAKQQAAWTRMVQGRRLTPVTPAEGALQAASG